MLSESFCTKCRVECTPSTRTFHCSKCNADFCEVCVETIPGDTTYVRCLICTSVILTSTEATV